MRENLIKKREARHLTRAQMARKCQCSPRLIFGIEEEDWITHPDIAGRLAKEYGFGVRTYNKLVHESRKVKVLPEPVPPPSEAKWKGYAAWSGNRKLDPESDPYMW